MSKEYISPVLKEMLYNPIEKFADIILPGDMSGVEGPADDEW